jgi:uncharacterized protein (DUF1330 family)
VTAYVIADIEVTDPAAYEGYKSAVGATIAAFGGRYLSRAGHTEVLEGGWQPRRLVILEFRRWRRRRPGTGRPATHRCWRCARARRSRSSCSPKACDAVRCADDRVVVLDGHPDRREALPATRSRR